MDLETIALIAMGGCLFLWLVVNFIITLHNVRKAKAAGLTVQVQCEKCGTIYEVTGKEATRPAMIKYKKSSRTHISNGAPSSAALHVPSVSSRSGMGFEQESG